MNNKLLFYFLLFYFLPQIVEKETGLTSLRIRAEKEKELQEAEAYWSKRFAKQEQEVRITTQVGSPTVRLRLARCTAWVKRWSEAMDFFKTIFITNISLSGIFQNYIIKG